jgi:hypothetical protein
MAVRENIYREGVYGGFISTLPNVVARDCCCLNIFLLQKIIIN